MNKFVFKLLFLLSILIFSDAVKANYWLVIWTYREWPGGRPELSGITSPSLYAIPMKDIETCKNVGAKISREIYKAFW